MQGQGDRVSTPNFGFLAEEEPRLVQLGALAERYFRDDPSTCLIKMRQFAELLAKLIAARHSLYEGEETFERTLGRLRAERILPREVSDLFHRLRLVGNAAVHEAAGTHAEALAALKLSRQLGVWFHRTFGGAPGAASPPAGPRSRASSRGRFARPISTGPCMPRGSTGVAASSPTGPASAIFPTASWSSPTRGPS